MLTGQAKTDYQREYMRKRRSNKGLTKPGQSVRPEALDPVRPNSHLNENGTAKMPVFPVKLKRDTAWLPQHRADKPQSTLTSRDCGGCKLLTHQPNVGLSCPAGKWATSIKAVFEQNINPNSDCIVKEEAA